MGIKQCNEYLLIAFIITIHIRNKASGIWLTLRDETCQQPNGHSCRQPGLADQPSSLKAMTAAPPQGARDPNASKRRCFRLRGRSALSASPASCRSLASGPRVHFCGSINILRDGPAWLRWIMICYGDYHSFCNFISIKRVRLTGVALPSSPGLRSYFSGLGAPGEHTWN